MCACVCACPGARGWLCVSFLSGFPCWYLFRDMVFQWTWSSLILFDWVADGSQEPTGTVCADEQLPLCPGFLKLGSRDLQSGLHSGTAGIYLLSFCLASLKYFWQFHKYTKYTFFLSTPLPFLPPHTPLETSFLLPKFPSNFHVFSLFILLFLKPTEFPRAVRVNVGCGLFTGTQTPYQ